MAESGWKVVAKLFRILLFVQDLCLWKKRCLGSQIMVAAVCVNVAGAFPVKRQR